MAEVFKLGIAANNNQPIKEVNSIEVLANKGIVGDRHFHDFNDPYNQLSLIEAENIDEYNIKFGLDIPYINFRRNVVTKGIKLNELIGKMYVQIARGEDKYKYHEYSQTPFELMGKNEVTSQNKANEELSKIFYSGSKKIGKF